MDARDISALGDALAQGLHGTTSRVEEVHQALARRSFGAYGPARRWPEAVHDRIAASIYSAVRAVGPAAIRTGALGIGSAGATGPARDNGSAPDAGPARDAGPDKREGSPRASLALGMFNGVFGDALARRRNGLALRMAVRLDGRNVALTPESLRRSFPSATDRIVVFVHGFGETDDSWRWFAQTHWHDPSLNYGELLRRERGFTPIYVRYNSGRPIDDSARELSDVIEKAVVAWPVVAQEILLVGHSFGGLVARDATIQAADSGARWVSRVSHVFMLGTPRGAIIAERWTEATGRRLSSLPETKPLAHLLDTRSAALKDLPGLVQRPVPAWIDDARLPSPELRVGHFKLLNHPVVYEQIKARLNARTAHAPVRVARAKRFELAARALQARRPSRRR
jgi:pimeloyl-ACP methyl ester carboxylesterase